MKKNFYRASLLSALALGMAACSEESAFIPGENSVETRASVENVVNLSQNPVYTLGEKGNDGIYNAVANASVNNANLTTLDVMVRMPQNITLTGISFTTSSDKVLCGEFACDANGVTATSASASNQLFVEFKGANGANFVEMNDCEGIRFVINVAPSEIEELDVCLHVAGKVIYKAEVERNIVPGTNEELVIENFETIQGNQWMSMLDDNTPVTRLSMPGTHDAGTGEGTVMSLGETQSLNLQEQWNMGIRVFDLRPGYKKVRKGFFKYENELHIYHGVVETYVSFDKAIKKITDNLKKNPDEFAVVMMQFENASLIYNDRNVWNSLMTEYLTKKLPNEFKVDYRPDLTLGDVRGKLLILSRDAYASKPVTGGYISGWNFDVNGTQNAKITSANGSVSALNVQDYYKVAATDSKCNAVCNFIDFATNSENGRLTINHASGYTTNGEYHKGVLVNASAANNAVFNYLTSDARAEGSAGIIMMDRVGVRNMNYAFSKFGIYGDLAAQAVINNNFKFKMTK